MIFAVAAVSSNGVIGYPSGNLPWHIPEDLAYFKNLTYGHSVIMGRKTYDSIGGPLPGRINVVLTSKPSKVKAKKPVFKATSVKEALFFSGAGAFVIGGSEVYRQFLPIVSRIYLTEVHRTVPPGIMFPEFKSLGFRETERTPGSGDWDFVIYDR